MVVIRLSVGGSKKRPFYNIVVTDSRNARDGRFIERVGYYNPKSRGAEIKLHLEKERIQYWTSQGAKASDRVAFLLKNSEKFEKSADEPKKAKKSAKKAEHDEKSASE